MQNAEAKKSFARLFEKLGDKNSEKRKQALAEIATFEDNSRLAVFWSFKDFLTFLKRNLMMEVKESHYQILLQLLTNYLDLSETAPFDF